MSRRAEIKWQYAGTLSHVGNQLNYNINAATTVEGNATELTEISDGMLAVDDVRRYARGGEAIIANAAINLYQQRGGDTGGPWLPTQAP